MTRVCMVLEMISYAVRSRLSESARLEKGSLTATISHGKHRYMLRSDKVLRKGHPSGNQQCPRGPPKNTEDSDYQYVIHSFTEVMLLGLTRGDLF